MVIEAPSGAPLKFRHLGREFSDMTAAAMKALDLFCAAGGATRCLMQVGFAVAGVDLRPQPRYCGAAFFQADALKYLATADMSRFDFIWASPIASRMPEFRSSSRSWGDQIQAPVALGAGRCLKRGEAPARRERGRSSADRPRRPMPDHVRLEDAGRGRASLASLVRDVIPLARAVLSTRARTGDRRLWRPLSRPSTSGRG